MNYTEIIETLHPIEIKVLNVLKNSKNLTEITKDSNLKEIEVMRALQWLENKKIIEIEKSEEKLVNLDINGIKYSKIELPEKRLLKELENGAISLKEIKHLDKQEIGISIGALKKKAALSMKNGKLEITSQGKELLKKDSLEDLFLKKKFPLPLSSLKDEELFALNNLKSRKQIIKIETKKTILVKLLKLGEKLTKEKIKIENTIDKLTPSIIKSESWKNKKFRRYDIKTRVPEINGGKRHFVNEAVQYIKRIWLDMGFTEMTGSFVESAFWDLDVLFVPQDHPAREMQDTFYIKGTAKLPSLFNKIKKIHENGDDTGSKGWGGSFSKNEASRVLLRTHTTCLSAHTLYNLKKENLPAKFFGVGKVFRNETLDWKHLFEFYQVEGIVVDPKANLKHLKGYLQEFYKKMGFEKIRIRPAHFPYTEPSLEIDVFHPIKKEWIELGGAGIFRPEVTKPLLGFECPVLAWGQGLGRIISDYWNITDIRELYSNDLKQLRKIKTWNK